MFHHLWRTPRHLSHIGGKVQQLSQANDGSAEDFGDNSIWLCHRNIDGYNLFGYFIVILMVETCVQYF